jgi:hypothetical protein
MGFMLDMRYIQQMLILGPVALWLAWSLHERMGKAVALLACYMVIHCLYVGFGYQYEPEYMHPFIQSKVHLMGAQSLIQIIVFCILGLALTTGGVSNLLWAIYGFCYLNTLFLAIGGIYGFKFGFFNAHSFDTGVFSLFVPMLILNPRKDSALIKLGLATAALCLVVGGRTALGVCALTALAYIYRHFNRAILFVICTWIGLAAYAYHDFLFAYANRVSLLSLWIPFWKDNVSLFYGAGVGSFEWIAPFFPDEFGQHRFLAHNDFFQLVFEFGLVGLALCLYCIYDLLKKANKMHQVITFVSVLFFMWVYFPMHFLISELLVFLLALGLNLRIQEENA